jgi:hypothetical protein
MPTPRPITRDLELGVLVGVEVASIEVGVAVEPELLAEDWKPIEAEAGLVAELKELVEDGRSTARNTSVPIGTGK